MAKPTDCIVRARNRNLRLARISTWLSGIFRYKFKSLNNVIKEVVYILERKKVDKNVGFERKFKFWILS
jgi:hypothetical protein